MSMSMTTPAHPNENAAALRDAIRSSDPQLSKFRPLSRILTHDDFNTGLHGWVELGGNYNGKGEYSSLDRHFRDFRPPQLRSEEHTSELQSRGHLVCRLLLEKKKTAVQQT